jgi:hypothetical protein
MSAQRVAGLHAGVDGAPHDGTRESFHEGPALGLRVFSSVLAYTITAFNTLVQGMDYGPAHMVLCLYQSMHLVCKHYHH